MRLKTEKLNLFLSFLLTKVFIVLIFYAIYLQSPCTKWAWGENCLIVCRLCRGRHSKVFSSEESGSGVTRFVAVSQAAAGEWW